MPTTPDRYPDLPSLLEAIRKRPGMFLGHKTVYGLSVFLAGLAFAENYHNMPASDRLGGFDMEQFERWVEMKFNPSRLSLNSLSLAEHLAGSDESGFDLWFSWYDEFSGATEQT